MPVEVELVVPGTNREVRPGSTAFIFASCRDFSIERAALVVDDEVVGYSERPFDWVWNVPKIIGEVHEVHVEVVDANGEISRSESRMLWVI